MHSKLQGVRDYNLLLTVPDKLFPADGCSVGSHEHFSGGLCRRLNLWLLIQTLVCLVPAVLVMCLQEEYLILFFIFFLTLLSLWAWWYPQNATKPQCSDHSSTQQFWAILSVPLLSLSHCHGFSQTWAKWCCRIPFIACFSLNWNHCRQYKECLKMWTNTGLCLNHYSIQYVCANKNLAGVIYCGKPQSHHNKSAG